MKIKICIKCGKKFPATGEYFRIEKKSKDGFINTCKGCEAKYRKQYRETHKEDISKRNKQYYQKNKGIHKKRCEKYLESHKEVIIEYRKQYKKSNKKRCIEYNKEYYQKNKTKLLEKQKIYRKKHKEHYTEYNKKYRKNNHEAIKLWRKNNNESINKQKRIYYSKNKIAISKRFKEKYKIDKEKIVTKVQLRRAKKKQLPHTLTNEQWCKIKQYFDNKCAYCGKELPLAQEHFIPLNKGGEYTTNNIICSCKSCNSSKRDKNFFEWYPKYRYYSKEREKKILKFLGYKDGEQQLSFTI